MMVGPGRSWPLPTDGCLTVLFLHAVRGTVIKDQWSRRQRGPEYNNGIKDQGTRLQLCLRKVGTTSRNFRKTVELEVVKRAVRISIRLWEVSDLTMWRGWPLVQSTALGKEQR
jgi:hypothetical protein